MEFTIKPPEGCKAEDIKIESKMSNNIVETDHNEKISCYRLC